MKAWLISLCGLLIFIISGLAVQYYLNSSASGFDQRLAKVQPLLAADQWDQSLIRLNSFKEVWKRTKPFWAVLTHHREMDSIEEALEKTIKAIASRSYPDAWIQLGVLRQLIKHVPERERFSLENIF